MSVRVLVVDDSSFFRRRVSQMLDSDSRISVVGSAENGREAIKKASELKPDVITMDIEMPVMDGISAVRHIMKTKPVPVLMFSSLTQSGAKATFDALEAGALDYLPKNFAEIASNRDEVEKLLRNRVWTLGVGGLAQAKKRPQSSPAPSGITKTSRGKRTGAKTRLDNVGLVVIGTSTGGPVALQKVLVSLPAQFPVPLVLVQHMPGTFTTAFAQRLDKMCAISVKEASSGDILVPATAFLAPGGKQMLLEKSGTQVKIRITDGDPSQNYKPCVDLTFKSAAKVFGGRSLGIIMTGMGADGKEGSRALKNSGSVIWAQDESSSVIYGMPMAVTQAGLSDEVLSLSEIGPRLVESV